MTPEISLGISRSMLDILTDVAVEDPSFIGSYIVPTLSGHDAYERVLSDLTDATMAVELEGAGLGQYDGLGNLGKSFLKKIGKAIKKVALAPVKIREKVAHVIVDAVKGKKSGSTAASQPVAASIAAPPPQASAPVSAPPPQSVAYSGPSTFTPPSSAGADVPPPQAAAPAMEPGPASFSSAPKPLQEAGMLGGGTLPLLALGIALAVAFGKPSKGGRIRKNPGRRSRRIVA